MILMMTWGCGLKKHAVEKKRRKKTTTTESSWTSDDNDHNDDDKNYLFGDEHEDDYDDHGELCQRLRNHPQQVIIHPNDDNAHH